MLIGPLFALFAAMSPPEFDSPAASSRLGEALVEAMRDAGENEVLQTLVVMQARADMPRLIREARALPKSQRPGFTRARLENFSRGDQAELLAVLDDLVADGDVVRARMLWNVNAHRVWGTKAALERIARVAGVAYVKFDPPIDPELLADASFSAASAGPTPQTLPFATSFEAGGLPPGFSRVESGATLDITSELQPSDGNRHVLMNGQGRATLFLDLNLSGTEGAQLAFDARVFGATQASGFGLTLRGADGVIHTFAADADYDRYFVDLAAAARAHDVDLDGVTRVGFAWSGDAEPGFNGLAIDNVAVTADTLPAFSAEPNIWRMGAPRVWELGHEGQGALILNIDEGTNPYHPDLVASIWSNPGETPNNGIDDDGNGYIDDVWGYDFADDDARPYDGSHGTNTAGIVTGDGTNNAGVRTGMAPGATMAIARIDSEGSALEAYAYAIAIGADVITSSYSFKFFGAPTYLLFRAASEAELAAGIVHANSIGNQGALSTSPLYPVPYNIATPGNCPGPWIHPSQVVGGVGSVLGVGGILLEGDADYVQGGMGPAAWEDVTLTDPTYSAPQSPEFWDYPYAGGAQPGLLKPDIAGYTVVRTTNGIGNYIDGFGGTSAATPHIGGALCLLVDVNETVPPRQLSQALQETAWDLGAAGKDIRHGAGRAQVDQAALKLLGTVTATPNEVPAGQDATLVISGPSGAPYVLFFGTLDSDVPLGLGLDVGIADPLVLRSGLHTGTTSPTLFDVALPATLPGGLEFQLQLLTDDTGGRSGRLVTSLVESLIVD